MSENLKQKKTDSLVVSDVDEGSAAYRKGVRPGFLLKAINGRPILDILDYQFHSSSRNPLFTFETPDGERTFRIRKDEEEDAGIHFEDDLADKIHTCVNKCVFCFIHQMPKQMRRSLYLMDDDFRLSFMHGAYITLTNLSEDEFERIIEQRLSPLYVSVHATDPDLRGLLLGKKHPEPILPHLRRLAENRISVHAQVVLCPGWNDGENLDRTLEDLAGTHPSQTGLRAGVESVAIVPVGLTRFRERLVQLNSPDNEYAAAMIRDNHKRQRNYLKRLGTRFVWLSDEWFFKAQKPFPGISHYEQFPQLEDGVGTVRLFLHEMHQMERHIPATAPKPLSATLVTGELASTVIVNFAERLNRINGVDVNVCIVKNRFFGGGINIAGLMTAQDIHESLAVFDTKETVCIPSICLRDRNLFLDDVTVDELATKTGGNLRVVGIKPREFLCDMGIIP
jgi:putative radical SAM enzyme (TIGR03279 family)